ncbi:MAG TPA: hydrogenase maturation protease, partial [Firmicutes bacterium]|nr:hydrogenase maturation protease [Bacillota bacterium]
MAWTHMKILIAGIGNLLMGDDGLGGHVVAKLQLRAWPENVRLLDIGSSPLAHVAEFQKADILIVIDAIKAETAPGTIHRITPSSRLKADFSGCKDSSLNAHGFSILDAIELARLKGGKPAQIIIYGIEPLDCTPGIGLSAPVMASACRLEEMILENVLYSS